MRDVDGIAGPGGCQCLRAAHRGWRLRWRWLTRACRRRAAACDAVGAVAAASSMAAAAGSPCQPEKPRDRQLAVEQRAQCLACELQRHVGMRAAGVVRIAGADDATQRALAVAGEQHLAMVGLEVAAVRSSAPSAATGRRHPADWPSRRARRASATSRTAAATGRCTAGFESRSGSRSVTTTSMPACASCAQGIAAACRGSSR